MSYDVVTIGAGVRDVFVETNQFRILETGDFKEGRAECLPAGAKIEVDDMLFTTGGGATNAAVTFARQGFSVASIIRVGDDIRGHEIHSELEKEGVVGDLVQIDASRPSGYSVLLLSPDGERTALVMRGASASIAFDEIPWGALETRWLHITSLGGNMDLLEKVVSAATEHTIEVFLNPGSAELKQKARLLEVLKHVDVLTLNLEEAARLVGLDRDQKEEVFRATWDAVKGIVVLTDGPRGVDVYDGKHVHHAGIFEDNGVADRTGAGDAFGAGFVAGLLRSQSAKEGIRVGSANATSVIEAVGAKTGILRSDQLEDDRWKILEISEEKFDKA